jgi:hypothetical protein
MYSAVVLASRQHIVERDESRRLESRDESRRLEFRGESRRLESGS